MPGQQCKVGEQGSGSSPGLGSWHGHPLSSARQDGGWRGVVVENQVRARPAAHLQHILPNEAGKAPCAVCSLECDAHSRSGQWQLRERSREEARSILGRWDLPRELQSRLSARQQ